MTNGDLRELRDFPGEKFEAVDRLFEAIDRRFDAIDRHFEAIDRRFDAMEERFESVEEGLDGIDERLVRVEVGVEQNRHHIEVVAEGVVALNRKLDAFRIDVEEGFRWVDQRFGRVGHRAPG